MIIIITLYLEIVILSQKSFNVFLQVFHAYNVDKFNS